MKVPTYFWHCEKCNKMHVWFGKKVCTCGHDNDKKEEK